MKCECRGRRRLRGRPKDWPRHEESALGVGRMGNASGAVVARAVMQARLAYTHARCIKRPVMHVWPSLAASGGRNPPIALSPPMSYGAAGRRRGRGRLRGRNSSSRLPEEWRWSLKVEPEGGAVCAVCYCFDRCRQMTNFDRCRDDLVRDAPGRRARGVRAACARCSSRWNELE
jgi:hypothetical protein